MLRTTVATLQAATRPRGTEYAGRSKIFATSIAQPSPLSLFIQSVPDIDAFTYQSENIVYGYASVALSVVVSVLYADMTIAADNQDYNRYAAIEIEFTSYMTSKAGICL